MQPETQTLNPTAEEAAALAQICDAHRIAPANAGWALAGLRVAREMAPDIAAGRLGADPARLADNLRKALREGEREMRRNGATRSQIAAWAAGVDEGHAVATAALYTALETARIAAFEMGAAMATDFVQKIEAAPSLLPILPGAVEAALNAALETGRAEGLTPGFLEAFQVGFIRGAHSVARPFITKLEQAERPVLARPVLTVVPLSPRRLRPEDFGVFPSSPHS